MNLRQGDIQTFIQKVELYSVTRKWKPPLKNSHVINKGVHEQPLVDEALPFRLLPLKVPVHVVGHDDAVRLVRQLDDEPVVVADHSFASDATRRCEHQSLPPLQVSQDVLICKQNEE